MEDLFAWSAAAILISGALCSMTEKKNYFIIKTVAQKGLQSLLYLEEGSFFTWLVNIFWRFEIKPFSVNMEKLEMTICISQHLYSKALQGS